MKIGIHSGSAFTKERTGVEEYTYQLIINMARLKICENCEFILYVNPKTADFIPAFPENFKIKKINCPYFWTKIRLSIELFLHPVDTLFLPANFLPFFHPKNTVVTIHGLEFEYLSNDYSKRSIYYLRQGTKEVIKKAKKIIAVSENTKNDIVSLYSGNSKKIKVLHHGVLSKKNIFKKRNFKNKYILYIGRLETKKNLIGIIEAFNEFKKICKNSYKLILAGKRGYFFSRINEIIKKSPYKKDIILTGYVSQKEKDKLYSFANIFLFPSFYEGFGMPIIEAQKWGVPVISSKISSIPEVAGERAALLVDPKNVKEIAGAIKRLAEDENLRQTLIKEGKENAKKYSWEKCAEKTVTFLLN